MQVGGLEALVSEGLSDAFGAAVGVRHRRRLGSAFGAGARRHHLGHFFAGWNAAVVAVVAFVAVWIGFAAVVGAAVAVAAEDFGFGLYCRLKRDV